ncbi:MAG: hypothetical protein KGK08_04765 [Acidobacteriota bacterium]|nr:hypothetical protein [Acidobacteriota bacterium]
MPISIAPLLHTPAGLAAAGVAAGLVIGLTVWLVTRRRLSPAEVERARRSYVASIGRITDGSITEAIWPEEADPAAAATPSVLTYRYSIGGVTYECAQDVSLLTEAVRDLRIDLPVQVRFDPRNPCNSIVVAESWSGLRCQATSVPNRPERLTTRAHTSAV